MSFDYFSAVDGQVPPTTLAASVARTALHDSNAMRRSSLEKLVKLPVLERHAAASAFVRDFLSEFEVRRRLWLRSMIMGDSDASMRQLEAGQLSRAQRALLSHSPPKLDEILTDRYLDRLLSEDGGVRNAGGWLQSEVQAQLDSISDVHVRATLALREVRNFLVHDSTEAEARLTAAIAALGELEPNMAIDRRLTRRVLSAWLLSDDERRLRFLSDSIILAWRAMQAAEAVGDV